MLSGKTILVTGGTGSFGKAFVRQVFRDYEPHKVIVYSRDEFKQYQMAQMFTSDRLRFFIGDVRDEKRLSRALTGVDYVIHAAAMKQVPAAEYNPFEAVQTNIMGAQNLINAALEAKVQKVVALSTDKACNPVNLYGATKLCSDKLFIAANAYSGKLNTRFAVVRYGNVLGSRGSVVPLFRQLAPTGEIPVTDERMTRFWITLPQAVRFVIDSFALMSGGELFIPKIPSMRITDLAEAVAPGCRIKKVGIRPGEKLHEMMISRDDSRHLFELHDRYIKMPDFPFWKVVLPEGATPVLDNFEYASDTNSTWLNVEQLREVLQQEGVVE
ncbi:MAG: UDP-N-acetylglucosamine 4,6-dehydratase (inverting) [Candidatus Riflebacteria bacterium]|jgi:UDP-N-acetylglucosamine 4,6-dehydratase|nr:UDP-N-acetylglucosamine 4,6-dehydratase (inverting) [Candidatus Riflebacteria bacterium]